MQERRKPREQPETFWPTHIFKEAVVALVVVIVLVSLSIFSPPPHESIARPMDTSYIPRPEWYFLFLFKLLEFFPGKLEVVGVIFVPGIAVLILLLLPFFDRNPATKAAKRPIAISAAAVVTTAIIFLTIEGLAAMPSQMSSPATYAELGKKLYYEQDCATCHALNGVGGTIGPDLAGLTERRTLSWIHKYLEDPLMINPNSTMPGYLSTLSHEEIESISVYLTTIEKTEVKTPQVPEGTKPAEAPKPPTPQQAPATVPPAPPTPEAKAPAPITPPLISHSLEGRSACLTCHETGIGGAPKAPSSHGGFNNNVCLSCHQTK